MLIILIYPVSDMCGFETAAFARPTSTLRHRARRAKRFRFSEDGLPDRVGVEEDSALISKGYTTTVDRIMGRTGQRRYSYYNTAYDSPSHYGVVTADDDVDDYDYGDDSLANGVHDFEPDVPTRRHRKTKSVQFDLSSGPSSRSARTSRRSRTPERPPNPFAPPPASLPAPFPQANWYWQPPVQTQHPPPPAFSLSFNPMTQPLPPLQQSYAPGPYQPPPAGLNQYPSNAYFQSTPPQGPPSANFLQPGPFAPLHDLPPEPDLYAAGDPGPPSGILRPSRSRPVARHESRRARTKSRPPRSPSRASGTPSRPPSRLKRDVEQVQRTLSDFLNQQQTRDRQDAERMRAHEAAERKATRLRDGALRKEMKRITSGISELRQEFRQSETHSEPSHRSDHGSARMYSAPAWPFPDEQQPYRTRPTGARPDSHQEEMNNMWEGKRALDPQGFFRDPARPQGSPYVPRDEFDRVSAMSSRVDPEHMQRAIRTGLEAALSELDGFGYPSSPPTAQRSSSAVHGAGDFPRRRQQKWRNGIYRNETADPQSSPFQPPPESTSSQRRRAAQYPLQTEAQWAGRPRRHRGAAAREGGGARTGATEMNITAQRSSAPSRPTAQAGDNDDDDDDDDNDSVGVGVFGRAAPPSRAGPPPPSRVQMSGGRGEIDTGTLVRRFPADQAGPRRRHANGYCEPYFENGDDDEDEEFRPDAESRGSRFRPPPVAPEPPR